MSRKQRLMLVAAAVAVAVIAFVIASPDGDEEADGDRAAQTAPEPTRSEPQAEPEPGPQAEPGAEPQQRAPVERISLAGGQVEGGPPTITVTTGETVRIVVRADAPDELHLHGYDIRRDAAPGRPARFRFTADIEGVFELESHVAEDAGRDPAVARLVVEPS